MGTSKSQERRKASPALSLTMENNQNPIPNKPNRKQLAPRDMIIVALAVLVLTRINWTNMNSFHVLILFLLFLMLMLRWANMRKEALRKQAMERYKEQFEAEAVTTRPAFQWEDAPAESSAEKAPAADMADDSDAAPAEEKTAE